MKVLQYEGAAALRFAQCSSLLAWTPRLSDASRAIIWWRAVCVAPLCMSGFSCLSFETGSHCVAQAGSRTHREALSLTPEGWQ